MYEENQVSLYRLRKKPYRDKKSKAQVCKSLGVDVFIEDALEHALPLANNGIPVLLFDRPWNRGQEPANTTRVFSWSGILRSLAFLLE